MTEDTLDCSICEKRSVFTDTEQLEDIEVLRDE